MSDHATVVSREVFSGVVVLTVHARNITEGSAELAALRDALFAVADGPRQVILDLHAVEFLSSACLGTLISVRRQLRAGQASPPPLRRRPIFAMFADRSEALAAIRESEPELLVLCGVSAANQDIFRV